jgi:hypothetical protein
MTKNEWIDFIFLELKDKEHAPINLDKSKDARAAINELYSLKLIENSGAYCKLTRDGILFIKSGMPYNEWLNKNNSTSVHIGHTINAPVNQSDFSSGSNSSLNINANNTVKEAKASKTTIKGIVKWVFAALAALGVIWEILHAYHITIKF